MKSLCNIVDMITNARLDDKIEDVEWTVNVTNTGMVRSDVVVQAFVTSSVTVPGVTPPIKELFDFARVHELAPMDSVTLIFGLSYRILSHYDDDGHAWLLPGDYHLVLNNEVDAQMTIRLVGEPMLIEDFLGAKHPPKTPVLSTPIKQNKKPRKHAHKA